jgi:hypothetical protein
MQHSVALNGRSSGSSRVSAMQCDPEWVAAVAAVILPCARPTAACVSIDGSNAVEDAHIVEQGGYMQALCQHLCLVMRLTFYK